MDIQSIYGGNKKTPAAALPSDEASAPATGFSALLDLVGSQFKATLGIGSMDPAVLKNDAGAEAVRAPEPREAKPRPERSDDKDAKAKPAQDDADDSDEQTEETAAAGEQKSDTNDAANAETGAEQAVQANIAAAVDVTAIAQTAAVTTVVATEVVTATVVETVAVEADAAVTEVAAVDTKAQTAQATVDPKAAQQADVKATEKAVAPEAVVKDTARVQQAVSAYAPAQETLDIDTVAVEADATAGQVKTTGKDDAVRTLEVRSAAAQEQANSIARLLGSENRVQVQVQVGAAHAMKQAAPDVSVYNIYAGYSAADAISLANGQFGQADDAAAPTVPAQRTDGAAQTAAAVQAAAQQITPSNANTQSNAPARTEAFALNTIQASASSNGASNANMGFGAFTQSGQSSGTQGTQQAAQPNPTDRPAATAQHVIDQIKVNITKAAKAGFDRVTILLKPVELGRLEIKLEMSEDHKVRVTVTADNKDTLNLLQTDSRTLERTLNDAGLRTDANNLHFNLRGDGDAGAADGQRGNGGNKNNGNAHADTANDNADPSFDYAAAANARGGVDTFA